MSFNKSTRRDLSLNSITCIDAQYEFIDIVGKGTYGTAWIAKDKQTGNRVVVKAVKKINTGKSVFKKEYKYSRSLSSHPNIIKTFDVAFETSKCFVMIQEFAPYGDLFDAIIPEQGMGEQKVKYTILQIADALHYMHSRRLVHRDVKPENIVIMDKLHRNIKLIDFGMTLRSGSHVARVCGSIPYTPPEICQASLTDGFFVNSGNDVWSLGVLLFCMLTGTFPWEQASSNDVHYKDFIDWQLNISSEVAVLWRKFTAEALELFLKMLQLTLSKRCGIQEVRNYVQYPWIDSNGITIDVLSDASSLSRTPLPDMHDNIGPPFSPNEAEKLDFLVFEDSPNVSAFNVTQHTIPPTHSFYNFPNGEDSSTNQSQNPSSYDIDRYTIKNHNLSSPLISPSHTHHFCDSKMQSNNCENLFLKDTELRSPECVVSHSSSGSISHNVSIC